MQSELNRCVTNASALLSFTHMRAHTHTSMHTHVDSYL